MQKQITIQRVRLVVEEEDYAISFALDTDFWDIMKQIVNDPSILEDNDWIIQNKLRLIAHRDVQESFPGQGSLGPMPTVIIYDSENNDKVILSNGQQES